MSRVGPLFTEGIRRYFARTVVLVTMYVVLGWLGLHFGSLPGGVTPLWPPSGFTLAFLVVYGIRYWPGVALGSILLDLSVGLSADALVGVMVANTLQPVAMAWLLTRPLGFRPRLDRARDILALLVVGGFVGSVFGASLGVTALTLTGAVPWEAYWRVWMFWALGDLFGVIIVGPLVMGLCATPLRFPTVRRVVEAGLLLLLVAMVSIGVYGGLQSARVAAPFSYVAFPLIILIGYRFGTRLVSVSVVLIAAAAVSGTALGAGPFVADTIETSLLFLMPFLLVVVLTGLLFAAALTQRRVAVDALADSEARLRTMFDHAALGIAIVAPDGQVLQVNRALEDLLGRTAQELVGSSFFARCHADDAAQVRAAFQDVVEGNAPRVRSETRYGRPDGAVVWGRLHAARIRPMGAAGPYVVAMIQDFTAEKRAEEADRLAAARLERIRRLEEMSAWKSQVLDIVSHEIKTPLTSVNTQLYLIKKQALGPLSDKQEEAVRFLERELRRITSLIDDVLDMSRIRHGSLRLKTRPVDIARLVQGALPMFREQAHQQGVRMESRTVAAPLIEADPDRIIQVVYNLLSNAVKFTPEGGRIDVACHPEDDGVSISVADTGPGLRPDQIQRMFQPFTQVLDTQHGTSGLGLGLSISKAIVEQHGGRIEAASPGEGQGTTFAVWLPRHPPEDTYDEVSRSTS